MSLKPPKKSDLNKEWLTKRRDRSRNIHPEYHLIVTEGTKTEPNYFESIKNRINSKFSERIHLDIKGEGLNTIDLFERAVLLADANPNGYKHVWVVYDTDDFPKDRIDVVEELCKQRSTSETQYHAIWSNQCIELWFLLHFSFMQSDIVRTEYFPKLSDNLKAISKGEYVKNREDIFDVLEPYVDDAIRNAKALDGSNKGRSPSNSKPGTKVYELVEKLKPYI